MLDASVWGQVFHIMNSILRKVAYLHTRSAVNLVAVD